MTNPFGIVWLLSDVKAKNTPWAWKKWFCLWMCDWWSQNDHTEFASVDEHDGHWWCALFNVKAQVKVRDL